MTAWDPAKTSDFFDAYGEREWNRFELGLTPAPSIATHVRMLERYVRPGDRVLDAGCGPGRFTIELRRIGAEVTALDISPGQLDLLRQRLPDVDAVVGDVSDLSQFADASFDVTVCYGGPISYLLDRADAAIGELARVTRPGGHVVVSVMSLAGTAIHYAPTIIDLVRRDGVEPSYEILRTGVLADREGYGHLPMQMYDWGTLEALLAPHGEVVDGAAAGVLPHVAVEGPEIEGLLEAFEARLADDPGARSCGEHIIGVLRVA